MDQRVVGHHDRTVGQAVRIVVPVGDDQLTIEHVDLLGFELPAVEHEGHVPQYETSPVVDGKDTIQRDGLVRVYEVVASGDVPFTGPFRKTRTSVVGILVRGVVRHN